MSAAATLGGTNLFLFQLYDPAVLGGETFLKSIGGLAKMIFFDES
jgi:hypothetical protein